MNFDDSDDELAGLIDQPERSFLPWRANNDGRVNPVQRQLRREQPQPGPFQQNNWRHNMPANGGYKKKRTNKNSKKYKNKKRQRQTRRSRKMK